MRESHDSADFALDLVYPILRFGRQLRQKIMPVLLGALQRMPVVARGDRFLEPRIGRQRVKIGGLQTHTEQPDGVLREHEDPEAEHRQGVDR